MSCVRDEKDFALPSPQCNDWGLRNDRFAFAAFLSSRKRRTQPRKVLLCTRLIFNFLPYFERTPSPNHFLVKSYTPKNSLVENENLCLWRQKIRLKDKVNPTEILVFKQLLDSKLHCVISFNPEVSVQSVDLTKSTFITKSTKPVLWRPIISTRKFNYRLQSLSRNLYCSKSTTLLTHLLSTLSEKIQENHDKITCPKCEQDCTLPPQGIAGLLSDYSINNILEASTLEGSPLACTGCKTKDTHAVARCFDCANYLCGNCVMAHQYMHCFEGHHVINLKEQSNKEDFKNDKLLCCPRHKAETLRFFCKTCNVPICKECTSSDHLKGLHDYDHISEIGSRQVEILADLVEQSKAKTNDLKNAAKSVEHFSSRLQMQYHKAQAEINDTFNFYCSVLEERKEELMKELEDLYNTKMVSLSLVGNKVQEMMENANNLSSYFDRITKFSSTTEILVFKQLLDSKLHCVISFNPEVSVQSVDLEFYPTTKPSKLVYGILLVISVITRKVLQLQNRNQLLDQTVSLILIATTLIKTDMLMNQTSYLKDLVRLIVLALFLLV
ncbi:b-box type zinc finger protein ncl-1 [Caerostris extrusa]|uniref:B-box type zinc finger protein ncl-1 n=1 Tax=Caerostris extrusa TaxID=172846 RepID=A0AAV4M872_CAEEX|nr:b-box type zinc finger protein ncl-1 [Caerostris extrusa]